MTLPVTWYNYQGLLLRAQVAMETKCLSNENMVSMVTACTYIYVHRFSTCPSLSPSLIHYCNVYAFVEQLNTPAQSEQPPIGSPQWLGWRGVLGLRQLPHRDTGYCSSQSPPGTGASLRVPPPHTHTHAHTCTPVTTLFFSMGVHT